MTAARDRILAAICRCLGEDPAEADPAEVEDLMSHLLPVVEKIAAERAAEELRAAAAIAWGRSSDSDDLCEELEYRAAALAPEEGR